MDKRLSQKFDEYPSAAKSALLALRSLILQIAENEGLGVVEESLKWQQPSYSCRTGSPIRLDWCADEPDNISVYFHCQTTLIATFKEVYSDAFEFKGNRELIVPMADAMKSAELAHCLSVALQYRNVKHLPLLGM